MKETSPKRAHAMWVQLHSGKYKTKETVERSVIAQGWGVREMNKYSTKNLEDS